MFVGIHLLAEKDEIVSDLILLENMQSLDDCEVASVDLNYEYWTPEKEGEQRRLYFMGIRERLVPDHSTDELVPLKCVVFAEPHGDGAKAVVNGSVVLVSTFENTALAEGTAVLVTYKGKKRTKSGNNADQWSVATLKQKGK